MSPTMIYIYAIASVIGISLLSLLGIVLFILKESSMQRVLLYVVSLSTGALLGDVFLHIIPEVMEAGGDVTRAMLLLLAGIVFSFAIEKIIHWRHCHVLPGQDCCGDHAQHHHHPAGLMSTIGEALHNTLDGVIIAAAFLTSIPVGISTTIAVMLHEIPHEVGNVAVLLHSGYSKRQSILMNLLSAIPGIVGAACVLALSSAAANVAPLLLPFAAGNLLYIAGSDLIPELHKETRIRQGSLQLACMVAGMTAMYLLLALE